MSPIWARGCRGWNSQIALAGAKARDQSLRRAGALGRPPCRRDDAAEPCAGDTESVQLFKQVVAGKSRAVYQGRITVDEGADGTDSRQTAKALLLDDHGEADLKPELIIFADDVKCAHGAAVGDLDAESLFYLRVARHSRSRSARTSDARLSGRRGLGNRERDDPRAQCGLSSKLRWCARERRHERGAEDQGRRSILKPCAAISKFWAARSTASRSPISTMPPRRRSRARCWTRCADFASTDYANVHRGVHYLSADVDRGL